MVLRRVNDASVGHSVRVEPQEVGILREDDPLFPSGAGKVLLVSGLQHAGLFGSQYVHAPTHQAARHRRRHVLVHVEPDGLSHLEAGLWTGSSRADWRQSPCPP